MSTKYSVKDRLGYTGAGGLEVRRNNESTDDRRQRGAYLQIKDNSALIPLDEIPLVIEALFQIEEQYADMDKNGNPELEPEYDARAVIRALPVGTVFKRQNEDSWQYMVLADGKIWALYRNGVLSNGSIDVKYFQENVKIIVLAP